MKKETGKKSKLWLWIVIAVAVLAIIGGVVAAFVLPGLFQDNGPAGPVAEAKLYWNLDRHDWLEEESGMSIRPKGEDGYYHISYLVDGKIEDIKVSDKKLVNYLDSQPLLCLAFDEAGICVDAVPFDTYFVEAGKDLLVKRFQNNNLELNSSISMDGMNMMFTIPNGIGIYEVTPGSEQLGSQFTPDWLDVCSVYTDQEGNFVAAYITGHNAVDAEVAWKINLPSSSGVQDVADENGVYNLEFAIDGKIEIRKCRDENVLKQLNSVSTWNRSMGLIYDEEGYIINSVTIQIPLRVVQTYMDAIVETINGNKVTGTTMTGVPVEFELNENTVIYNTCSGKCQKDHVGEVCELFVGDRVQVYADLDGKTALIYKAISRVEWPVHYKLSKTRDAEGYVVYEMAVNGKVKSYKTKDDALVKEIDACFDNTMALKTSGSIIKDVASSNCAVGFTRAANGSYVTSAQFPVLTHISYTDPTTMNAVLMNSDCKIYLVDDYYKTKRGSVTEVQQYDRITALRNPNSEVVYVFVTMRYRPGHKMAVNLNPQYAGTETTRVPNAEGYYVFDFAIDGKQVQGKTKDKDLASYIDKFNYPALGVKINKSGIITSACNADAVIPYGMHSSNNHRVLSTENNILKTYYTNNGINKFIYGNEFTLTSKTKIYNLSPDNFEKYRGEKTKIKQYDKVQAITRADTGEIQYVFIADRPDALTKLYVNAESNPPMGSVPVRTPDKDGYYNIKVYSDGKTMTVRTKDAALCAKIDGCGISTPYGLTFKKGTNIIEGYYPADRTQHFLSLGPVDVCTIEEDTFTVKASGQTTETAVTKSEGTKIIDIDPNSKTAGKKASLKKGDRVRIYSDGDMTYVYIIKRAGKTSNVLVLDKKGYGECPTCGKVKWEEYTGAKRYGTTDDGPLTEHVHLYLKDDATYPGTYSINAAILGNGGKICFHLNGHTLNVVNSRYWLGYEVSDNFLYFYGEGGGEVLFSQRTPVQSNSGPVNIIGGTYTPVGEYIALASIGGEANFKDTTIYSDIKTNYRDAHIKLLGSTKTYMINLDAGGKLELDSSWSGTAILDMEASELLDGKVPADKVFYTGAEPTGKMTLATGEPLVYNNGALEIGYPEELTLDGNKGVCSVCNKTVTWEKYDGSKTYAGINTHRHFYLDKNATYTNASADMMSLVAGGKVCFNLNGKSLTVADGRFVLGDDTSVLNLITNNGKILYSNPTNELIAFNKGKVNVYGGSYSAVDTAANFTTAGGAIVIKDAIIKAQLVANNTVELQGAAKINKIDVANGQLKLNSNWSGAAILNMTSDDLTGGKVPTDKVSYTGSAPTGIMSLASCEQLKYVNGGLEINMTPSGKLVLDDQGFGMCPVCGDVKWTVYDGTKTFGSASLPTTEKLHLYLADDATYTGELSTNAAVISGDGSLCLHLNGHTLDVTNGRFWLSGGASEKAFINVFGTNGKINYSNPSTSVIQQYNGSVGIYGGTYTAVNSDAAFVFSQKTATLKDATVKGRIQSDSVLAVFKLEGTANVGKINLAYENAGSVKYGSLEVASNWTGTATLNMDAEAYAQLSKSKVFYTGAAPTGTLKLTSGEVLVPKNGAFEIEVPEELILDGNNVGKCPVCNSNVTWTAFDGTAAISSNSAPTTSHQHIYLASDVTYNGNAISQNIATISAGGSICLHLNGKTLNVTNGRLWIGDGASDNSTINIITTNGVVNYSDRAFIQQNKGIVNIHGGTYNCVGTAFDLISSGGSVVLKDATVNAGIASRNNDAVIELQGATSVKKVNLDNGGQLKLNSNWTGTTILDMDAADLTGGKVPADKAAYTGTAPTGTVKLATGEILKYVDGTLELDATIEGELILDANGYGVCPACGDVKWEKYDGTKQYTGIDTHRHFYLASDTTYSYDSVNLLSIYPGGNVCFHLNGKTLTIGRTAGARFWLGTGATDAVLNIFGNNGKIVYQGRSILQVNDGAVNVYGGEYSGFETFAESYCYTEQDMVTLRDATVSGNLVIKEWRAGFKLEGSTTVNKITVDYLTSGGSQRFGKLELASDWTGTATLDMDSLELTDGKVSKDVVFYNGTAPTGTVMLASGETLLYKDGGLELAEVEESVLVVDSQGYGDCPVCGRVKWEVYDGTVAISSNSDPLTTHRHLYLTKDTSYDGNTISGNMATIAAGGKLCFHLNGKTLTVTNGRLWLGTGATDAVLNIFGNDGGKVVHSNKAFVQVNDGAVNIYGGEYSGYETFASSYCYSAPNMLTLKDATVSGNLVIKEWRAGFKLEGSTSVNKITVDYLTSTQLQRFGKLELASNWTGTAVLDLEASELTDGKVSKDIVFYTGAAPTGTLTLASGETLLYNDGGVEIPVQGHNAVCPVCGEAKTWTEFDGTPITNITGEQHIYLADNVTDSSASTILSVLGNANVCFDLNGKTLTTGGSIVLNDGNTSTGTWNEATGTNTGSQENGVFNLIGNGGTIIYTGSSNLVQHTEAKLNVIGGTYTASATDAPIFKLSRGTTFENATINGNVILDSVRTMLELKGSTGVNGKITVVFDDRAHRGEYELLVDSSWTGAAVLEVPASALVDGVLDPTRYVANGNFTGALTLTSEEKLANKDGKLVISNDAVPADAQAKIKAAAEIAALDPATVIAGNTCPMCGATDVTWTKKTGRIDPASNSVTHVYYTGDVTVNEYGMIMLYNVNNNAGVDNAKVCVVLKDANITNSGIVVAGGTATNSVINIMGNGTVNSTGTKVSGADGTVNAIGSTEINLYGGNYTFSGTYANTDDAVAVIKGQSVLNMYDGVTFGNATQDTSKTALNLTIARAKVGDTYYTGTVNMYGGTIRNGVGTSTSGYYGGNVYIGNGAVLNMFGGSIENAYTTYRGGNVYVYNGTFTMYGGTISEGRANRGGNIAVEAGGIDIKGGTIENGETTGWGGNIYLANQGGFNKISGGLITGGETAQHGGNLYIFRGITQITGGTIENGTVKNTGNYGGNICLSSTEADVTIKNAIIRNGSVATAGNGANFYTGTSVQITLENTKVIGSTDAGIVAPKLNVLGGTITGSLTVSAGTSIQDATVEGNVDLTTGNSVLTLKGNTNITGNVNFNDEYGASKVIVDTTFTGSVNLNPNEGMYLNGNFDAVRGVANGDFTGAVKVGADTLVNSNGALVKVA